MQNTQFIRCIKPNNQDLPKKLDNVLVLQQLKSANITAYARLMQLGYPVRFAVNDLNQIYGPYIRAAEIRQFYMKLFLSIGLKLIDFKFGENLVFFRTQNKLLDSSPNSIELIISKMRRYIARTKFRTTAFGIVFLKSRLPFLTFMKTIL